MLEIGPYSLHAIECGRFALDGGAMFGIVPRPLWQRALPPDERHRIPLATRLLLIRGPERTWLVDTGLGDKFGAKESDIYDARPMLPDEALRGAGFDPGLVTDVVLTHLHFDHAGGAVRDDGTPVFPDARYHVQQRQFEWARSPSLKDRGSFRPADFLPLYEQDRLVLADGRTELADGLEVVSLDGHTPGMQMVRVTGAGTSLLYVADLVPTAAHVRTAWVMAYDNEPLRTVREKAEWLGRAADGGWTLFLEHDPDRATCRVRRGARDFELEIQGA